MASEKSAYGVVVEFDFTVANGAETLFEVAKKRLAEAGIELTIKNEALHLAGGNYLGGFTELLQAVDKPNANAASIAADVNAGFAAAIDEKAESFLTADFKAFVKALVEKGVKVVVASRADTSKFQAFGDEVASPNLAFHHETASSYGGCKWDAWRRAANVNALRTITTVGVAGSGYGVKAALLAGFSALGVVNAHVEYQDFGGADAVVSKLDAAAAKEVLAMLKIA